MTDVRSRAIQLYDTFTNIAIAGNCCERPRRWSDRLPLSNCDRDDRDDRGIATAAQQISGADPRLVTRKGSYAIGDGRMMTGYLATDARRLSRKRHDIAA